MINHKSTLYYLVIVFFLFVFFQSFHQTPQTGVVTKPTKVIVYAKATSNDSFELFYTTTQQPAYSASYSIRKNFTKSDGYQAIEFELPGDSIQAIRLDLGNINAGSVMDIDKIILKNQTEYTIARNELLQHFVPNQYVETIPNTHRFLLKQVADAYDPFLSSKDLSYPFEKIRKESVAWRYLLTGIVSILLAGLCYVFHKNTAVTSYSFFRLGISIALTYLMVGALKFINFENSINSRETEIEAEVLLKKEDTVELFYTTEQHRNWDQNFSLRQRVTGSIEPQLIHFSLPDSLKLVQIRLDISQEPSQDSVWIGSIKLTHNGNKLVFGKDNLLTAFTPNEWLNLIDNTFYAFRPKVINNTYDPFLVSKDVSVEYEQVRQAEYALPIIQLMALFFGIAVYVYLEIQVSLTTGPSPAYIFKFQSFSFLFLLLLPSLYTAFSSNVEQGSNEKRQLKTKPAFDWKKVADYPKAYTDYFDDNFGLRTLLINVGANVWLHLFEEAQNPDRVVIGKQGWFFLSGSYDNILNDYARRNLYDSAALVRIYEGIQYKNDFCKLHQARYYKAYYPNKQSIYPEFLPLRIRVQQRDTVSRIEQLNRYLKERNSPVQVIDVRKALYRNKSNAQLYFKYDTHWNEYGAFIGYASLFRAIEKEFPSVHPTDISAMNIDWRVIQATGDLIQFSGIADTDHFLDSVPTLNPKHALSPISCQSAAYPGSEVCENPAAMTNLVAVVFHDSFTLSLKPFINQHFRKVIYCWTDFNPVVVEREKPNIVIEGYTERLFR